MDIFAIATWAYRNRADIESLLGKVRPILDLAKAEDIAGTVKRLVSSFPSAPSPSRSVTWVQTALNRAGFAIQVDGTYGQQTREAIERFQQAHALTIDGWAGPATVAVLESYLPG